MANDHKLQLSFNFEASAPGKLEAATVIAVLAGTLIFSGNPANAQAPCSSNQLREYNPETYRKNCMSLPKATTTRIGVLREIQQLRIQNLKRQQ
tara:strand:+ start:117 stop:398 length:282 start_codon:yes stop_codon:yes gene_type:complete